MNDSHTIILILKLTLLFVVVYALGYYFNKNEDTDIEQCPFLIDEDNVRKIRLAKEIILKNMSEPPSLQELSEEIGLSLNKLKEGFKQLYGDTVFGYLLNHKMEEARRMLASTNYNVNEVGLRIGSVSYTHLTLPTNREV